MNKMRLIDADVLLQTLNYRGIPYSADINAAIIEAPSVDTATAVHAHWYFDPDKSIGRGITVSGMFCSNCGGDCPAGSHPYKDFKYCPHCGAKMDEETEK